MSTQGAVAVEVYCFNLDLWTPCTFVASRPGFTLVRTPAGAEMWFANNNIRFPR